MTSGGLAAGVGLLSPGIVAITHFAEGRSVWNSYTVAFFHFRFCCCCFCETGSFYVPTGLKPMIFLPEPLKVWDSKCELDLVSWLYWLFVYQLLCPCSLGLFSWLLLLKHVRQCCRSGFISLTTRLYCFNQQAAEIISIFCGVLRRCLWFLDV